MANEILNFCNAIVKPESEQSEQEVRESVMVLFNSVPTSWIENDKYWNEDLKTSIIYEKVDNRNQWCNRRVGIPYCPHLNDSVECPKCEKFDGCPVKEEKVQPYRLFHCVVNCLDRMNMLSKKAKIEVIDGKFKITELTEDNDGVEEQNDDSGDESEA